ncbi:MAG: tRNA epoxyqueuosine(34) reductase QueG [Bacteroidales bacterium]|nr:tRNA epoxyqueuosine(34) reductase QueG [Bacteroidales bacterium]MCF8403037.1 tRNA epoxyqueuosine(34) reductase QueG [Bacteroidales bacterium]
MESLSSKIKTKALELGFFSCGISKAQFLQEDAGRLSEWLKEGKHAGMTYMENYFEKRTNPYKLLDNAKSVISVLYNYSPPTHPETEDNYQISAYAYGKDYHFVLKRKLKSLIAYIESNTESLNARAFVDSAPVLDRAWAQRAGLGWIGKNTCLITKTRGSYFFIGEIILDLELEYDNHIEPDHCGGCTRCIEACPTRALTPHSLDSNKCISYLTIENKEESIPDKFKGQFGEEGKEWIFGCDICQQVCPWNRFAEPHNEPDFLPNNELLKMRKEDWRNLDKNTFDRTFNDSPVKRAKFEGLKRNILFVDNKKA